MTARPAALLADEAGRSVKGAPADLGLFRPEPVGQVAPTNPG
jgi:hypothetical protein